MSLNAAKGSSGNFEGAKGWFEISRFGMFIHFGLYSLGARHEWLKEREEMTTEEYTKYFEQFDPDLFDARDWARQARAAGMKYVVLTAKHHDGFCLWDSSTTDFKSTNTPFGRDIIKEYVDALKEEGLKVGFYYSLIDWHHSHFPIDVFHPQKNHPDALEINADRDITLYSRYMHDQVHELMTQFGEIDIIWFDFSYPTRTYRDMPGKGRVDWDSENLERMVRDLQPNIIIGDRLDLPRDMNSIPDLVTPEQYTPRTAPSIEGVPVRWEACHTLSGSWGYHRDESTWKDASQLINLLVDTVSLGGNLLMNVGPTGRGNFDQRAQNALKIYGKWLSLNDRAIYGAGVSEYEAPDGCRYTQQGNKLYLHIQNWPFRHLHLKGLGGKVKYAQFLNDASEVQWLDPEEFVDPYTGVSVKDGDLSLELPVNKPNVIVPVVELILKED
ncbi:alpha-L-fucosidase [Vibrio sp. SCSIO 43132]|uniref:alpha-L-fucosidase n=1 Tax=Vibrio sp. SCSIO 43132 TaxID=2779363 RepID=UPI001CA7FD43|nr:alpha-L-fucosidase [Vibrio sp. SCSIO 43132]UAB69201.1 alpha-L-fucosidase [Vibrio sp. SCSIO 43132]